MATYQSVGKHDQIVTGPHMERAERALAAAVLLQREGFHADAACRAHQSTIHAERALLATEKRSPTSIRTVHRLAEQHFVKPGQVDPAFMPRLQALGDLRSAIDEQPAGEADAELGKIAIATAEDFLTATADWIGGHGYGASKS
jgi:uncharacterized protein (UPF0332 family)